MRSRGGSFVGTRVEPNSYYASGLWTIGEEFIWIKENKWPKGYIEIYNVPEISDATNGGTVTVDPVVYYSPHYAPLVYQWQKSTNGGALWSDVAGKTAEDITLTGQTTSNDGDMYRVIVTGGIRVKKSTATTIWKDTVTIGWGEHPDSTTVGDYTTASFYATATMTGQSHGRTYTPAFQWQRSINGGATWSDLDDQIYENLSFTAQIGMTGYRYRLRATFNGISYFSNYATLTVI